MATAVVLPDITGGSIVDLRDHYFAHTSWFFGFMLASAVFSAAKEFALNGHLPDGLNGEFNVIFILAAIAVAITRRGWVHKLLAPAFALLFLLYISLLFARLWPASVIANEVPSGLVVTETTEPRSSTFCLHPLAAEVLLKTLRKSVHVKPE